MNSFFNKILVSVLITGIFIFSFLIPQVAYADGVLDFAEAVFGAISNIVNTIVNIPIALIEIGFGSFTGISFLTDDGNCRLTNRGDTFVGIYAGECGEELSGVTIVSSGVSSCTALPLTFYNTQYNINYNAQSGPGYILGGYGWNDDQTEWIWIDSGSCQPGSAPPEQYDQETGNYFTPSYRSCSYNTCNSVGSNDNSGTITLYRFSISKTYLANEGWIENGQYARLCQILNDTDCDGDPRGGKAFWHSIGDGFLNINLGKTLSKIASIGGDYSPFQLNIFTYPAEEACNGSTCVVNDAAFPPDSYVLYAAKINGSYTGPTQQSPGPGWTACDANNLSCPEEGGGCVSCTLSCSPPVSASGKFLSKDTGEPRIPNLWNNDAGTIELGLYDTGSAGECPAPAVSLSANPTTISRGQSSTLTWTSADAEDCGIDHGIGDVPTSGSRSVSPSNTTTYTITCGGVTGGSVQSSATVTVLQQPGDFNLNTGGSVACNSVPLSWAAASGADGYRILRGSARVDISPYQPYTALNFTDTSVSQNTGYLYQIEAYNGAGTNRSNAINITTPYCLPTLSFSGSPTDIFQGQTSTLIWSSSYTASCIASGKWSGFKSTSGSEVVQPSPPPSATYILSCSGPGGSVGPQSVTINISPLALPNWKEIIPR